MKRPRGNGEMRDGDHGRPGLHYYCDGPEHPMINYRHAHLHDGPKDDCDDDPGDAPRRPRPRIAEEAEQTFVRVPRPLHGPDALRIQQEGVLRQLTQALEHSD